MRLITWNILSGTVLSPGINLLGAIKTYNADVLALQEVDYLQERSSSVDSIEKIAEEAGYKNWVFAPALYGTPGANVETAISHKSYIFDEKLPPSYGIALLSKIHIVDYKILRLHKAPIGLPLVVSTAKGQRIMYVKDEPRVAIAAILENGVVVVTAHLSFVPPYNSIQLRKIKRWASNFGDQIVFLGDFNALIFGKAGLKSLNDEKSYPGWNPKLKFDFILSDSLVAQELQLEYLGVSDHLPLGVKV
jgi:endonuclease/exonuclease/phosphatase family metal-dependent hydrolase